MFHPASIAFLKVRSTTVLAMKHVASWPRHGWTFTHVASCRRNIRDCSACIHAPVMCPVVDSRISAIPPCISPRHAGITLKSITGIYLHHVSYSLKTHRYVTESVTQFRYFSPPLIQSPYIKGLQLIILVEVIPFCLKYR